MSGPGDSGDTDDFRSLVVPRFLRYVRVCTASDRHVEETPSTPGQWELARLLAEELRALGLAEVEVTGHCYVLARLPENPPGPQNAGPENPAGAPAIGLLAHLDTAQDVSGQDVKPVLVEHYDGKKITLNGGAVLDPAADPDLAAQRGRAIIHTDGSTLLGADD
ncbi:MAG: hypothetical protein LBD09_00420, partial [Treponema sp.]|nr:hypothetical protein [Treponema sp.]